MPEIILKLSQEVSHITKARIKDIGEVTRRTKIIAMNALIEASRIGAAGKGFSVVANEVHAISDKISEITDDLEKNLSSRVQKLDLHGRDLIAQIRGDRLVDLSINLIDIIDRNLYERSCDVRWWATEDSLVKAASSSESKEELQLASNRLQVILQSYTVYADIWLTNLDGKIIAHGRRNQFPSVLQTMVTQEKWFQEALRCHTGGDYTVADIQYNKQLNQNVATYCTVVRKGGQETGEPIGVLAVFFDWQKQSKTVVESVRLRPKEKSYTRSLILDKFFQVIASSDRQGLLTEKFPLETRGEKSGNYTDQQGRVIGFAQTSGYETYPGLGWYGVVVQDLTQVS